MDNAELITTVARLSLRLSKSLQFLTFLLLAIVDLVVLMVSLVVASSVFYILSGNIPVFGILATGLAIVCALLAVNVFTYKRLIRYFFAD